MKNVSRKWLAVLFSLVLLFSVALSACASNEGNGSNANPPANTSGGDKGAVGANEPAEKKKLELSFYIDGAPETVFPDDGSDFVLKTIEEKFNVDLKITKAGVSKEDVQKLSLLVASGDAPDLFTMTGSDSIGFSKDGILADLKNLQTKEKMPNLFNWVDQTDVDSYQTAGKYDRGIVPAPSYTEFSYFIRQDWLDALGLKTPTNYEELTEVARAFTEDDPDGNSKKDTYAVNFPGDGKTVHYAFPQFREHGLYAAVQVNPETKEFEYSKLHPKTGAVLDDIRVWLDAGYVDPDFFLSNGGAVKNKTAQGKLGIVWVLNLNAWMFDSNPDSVYNQLKKQVPEAKMVPFNPFPDQPMWSKDLPWKVWSIFSKTSDEKKERIIEIIDWLYSEEAYLMTHHGIEGKHYTRDGNKIYLVHEAYNEDVKKNGNFLEAWDFLTPEDPEVFGLEIVDARFTERDREIRKIARSYPTIQGFGTTVAAPEGFDWGSFTSKREEILTQYLFEPKKTPGWDALLHELMADYGGNNLFRSWTKSMTDVGVEVKPWEDL